MGRSGCGGSSGSTGDGVVNHSGGDGGDGGNGGLGITGSLTVYGGTVNVSGGAGGNGGSGGTHYNHSAGKSGNAGSDGRALGGVVTCTSPNYVIRDCYNYEWTDLASGSTSSKRRIQVFEKSTFTVTAHRGTFAGQTRYWATFYHPTSTFLLPAEAQAFTVSLSYILVRVHDGNLVPLDSIIPADCAVVIMVESSSTNDSIEITLTKTSPNRSMSGILRGTSTPTDASSLVTGTNKKVYVLGKDAYGNVGFFQFTGTIPANKAYYIE